MKKETSYIERSCDVEGCDDWIRSYNDNIAARSAALNAGWLLIEVRMLDREGRSVTLIDLCPVHAPLAETAPFGLSLASGQRNV